uniref:Uncharacterized protein n=1 Tax=Kalanchoe fedtschenkoi TaxID=63787 RepID=A0A7N0TI17_KALFE
MFGMCYILQMLSWPGGMLLLLKNREEWLERRTWLKVIWKFACHRNGVTSRVSGQHVLRKWVETQ